MTIEQQNFEQTMRRFGLLPAAKTERNPNRQRAARLTDIGIRRALLRGSVAAESYKASIREAARWLKVSETLLKREMYKRGITLTSVLDFTDGDSDRFMSAVFDALTESREQ